MFYPEMRPLAEYSTEIKNMADLAVEPVGSGNYIPPWLMPLD
jgi:hypothetical protein